MSRNELHEPVGVDGGGVGGGRRLGWEAHLIDAGREPVDAGGHTGGVGRVRGGVGHVVAEEVHATEADTRVEEAGQKRVLVLCDVHRHRFEVEVERYRLQRHNGKVVLESSFKTNR